LRVLLAVAGDWFSYVTRISLSLDGLSLSLTMAVQTTRMVSHWQMLGRLSAYVRLCHRCYSIA